jgi:hypothetical protein
MSRYFFVSFVCLVVLFMGLVSRVGLVGEPYLPDQPYPPCPIPSVVHG